MLGAGGACAVLLPPGFMLGMDGALVLTKPLSLLRIFHFQDAGRIVTFSYAVQPPFPFVDSLHLMVWQSPVDTSHCIVAC